MIIKNYFIDVSVNSSANLELKKASSTRAIHLLPRLMLLALAIGFAPISEAKKDLFGTPAATESTHTKSNTAESSSAAAQPSSPAIDLPPPPEPELTPLEMREQAAQKKSRDASSNGLWGSAKNGIIYLRDEIFEIKDNLIGKPKNKKSTISTSIPQGFQSAAPEYTAFETKLTPTDAVKKALTLADGQIMNLRMYREGDTTLYSVKLLQKDGRMRSIYLDANTGEPYEYAIEPIEE